MDELEEESPIKRIEPQSLSSKPKRSEEILDEGNSMEIDHSGLAITLGEAIRYRKYTVAITLGMKGVYGPCPYIMDYSN